MTTSSFFFFAAIAAMIGVLGSLMGGLFAMSKEGEQSRVRSNKMMQWRIILQALAILFLFLAAGSK